MHKITIRGLLLFVIVLAVNKAQTHVVCCTYGLCMSSTECEDKGRGDRQPEGFVHVSKLAEQSRMHASSSSGKP